MANNATIGLAVAGGYLLGRTRKAKMAIGLGMFVAGRKLNLGPQLGKLVTDSPVLGEIGQTVRTRLVDATTAAASAALTRRANSLADALHERTLRIGGTPGTDPEDASSDAHEEADADDARPPEEQGAPRRRTTQTRRTSAGRTRTAAAQSARKAGGARKAATGGSRKTGDRGGRDA